jgi:hypothetical protein
MATALRSDVHREGSLVPAHYRFEDILDLYAGTNKDDVVAKVSAASVPSRWAAFVARMRAKVRQYRRNTIGDRPSLAQCSICGAHIRYAVVWSYQPEGKFEGYITTGTDCAESMGSAQASEIAEKAGALREFVAGMRRAAKEAEVAAQGVPAEAAARWSAIAEKRRAWITESTEHRLVANYLHRLSKDHAEAGCDNCFYCSVTQQLVEEGWLSDKQVASVLKAEDRYHRTALDPEPKITVPSGQTTVRGEVVSVKGQKMLTQARGYRVWGAFINGSYPGASVQFVANVEPSLKDPTFLIAHDVREGEVL